MKWTCIQLGNIADVLPGYAFKSADMGSVGFPVVRIGDIDETGRVDGESALKIPETLIEKRHTKYFLTRGDIVLSMTGEGKLGMVVSDQPLLLNQRVALIRARKPEDQKFLWFALGTANYATSFSQLAAGAAQQNISGGQLENMSLPYPPSNVRVRIAGILSAYDDLIENNRRRMKLLEEAARQLYREWFVRLRFPGHERGKIKDGLPEGWEKTTAFDAVEILSGGTPKTTNPDFWDGEIPFYTPKDAVPGVWVTGCERTITEAGLNNCNSRLYPKGTVFISARGTVGKLNMAQQPMAMSQSCYALVGKNGISQPFVFFAMLEGVEALRQQAVGAVFDAIIVDTFKRIPFVVPDARMRVLFDEMADPILAQVENLTLQSQKLRAARDLLLPKLMSGELAV